MKKTLSIILCLVIVLSAFGIIPVQFAAADVDQVDTGADVEVAETGNPYPTTQNVDKDNYYEIPCTWFAWQQAYDRKGISLPDWGNAVNWWQGAQNAGYSTGSTPQPDSIAVWSGDYYGHVAYVTSVSGGNTFTVNEGGRTDLDQTDSHGIAYGYTLTNAVGGSRPYDTGKTLLGFIYLTGSNYWYSDLTPVDLGTGFYAYIEHQSSGLFLTNSSRNVEGTTPEGSSKQIWVFYRQSNGAYSIKSLEDGYYMDVYGVYDADNTNVHTWPEYTGGNNQQFYIYKRYGAYYFRPAHSNERVFDMESNSRHNLSIWVHGDDWSPQEFNIIKIDVDGNLPLNLGDEFYSYIEHQKSGLFLTKQGNNIAGEAPKDSDNQIWKFHRLSNGAYSIQSHANGSFFDVNGLLDEDDTDVYTWPEYTGNKNQQFYIYKMYGAYYFRPAHSNTRMLDMSSASDHNLELWVKGNDWSPQKFNIIKLDLYGALPDNLGNEFVAKIEHQSSGLFLTNVSRNIYGDTKTNDLNQVWKFTRTNTGAYKIQSMSDNYYLDVYGVYDEDGTNVYTWPEYTGDKNQQFFIYNLFGAVYLRPLHSSTRVLDMSSKDGHNLELWVSGEDWNPQKFNIIEYQGIILGDADGDGEISAIDVAQIMRYVAHIDTGVDEEVLMNADVDGNGELEIVDATYIQRYLTRMETPYAIGEAI